ncbi:MAG: DUF4388 domain-containing protein [Ktedonobacteraceae bacterium]|nr:DUF4388 domain-containing protein [Ktedonobacteraceae bacterium]
MKPRGTVTEKLADVIQLLQLTHKTGLLTVERSGMGNTLEQGVIRLVNGQITDASLGPLRGAMAFDRLMSWGTCYFVFQPVTTSLPSSVQSQAVSPMSSGPLPSNLNTDPLAGPVEPVSESITPLPAAIQQVVPYRIRSASEILPYFSRLGLSRTHRQLFLLIDGQRTLEDLVRLMGHRADEIRTLLADLERAGLIRLQSL